jgi:single-strand DNA-binding protein
MGNGISKVILVGNLGANPEMHALPSGASVANLSLATTERWRSGNETKQRTEWHKIVAFGPLVGQAQALKTGELVYVEGSLRTRKWQDKEGRDRWTTEIVAKSLQALWGAAPEATEDDVPY